jgi:hypothetical protein
MITPEGKKLEEAVANLYRAITTLKMREKEWAETQAYREMGWAETACLSVEMEWAETQAYDEDYARGKP